MSALKTDSGNAHPSTLLDDQSPLGFANGSPTSNMHGWALSASPKSVVPLPWSETMTSTCARTALLVMGVTGNGPIDGACTGFGDDGAAAGSELGVGAVPGAFTGAGAGAGACASPGLGVPVNERASGLCSATPRSTNKPTTSRGSSSKK